MARNTTPREQLPVRKQLELAEIDLANAKAAVEALPAIERTWQDRVLKAQDLLDRETEQLRAIVDVEKPEAKQRVKDLEAKVRELRKRNG